MLATTGGAGMSKGLLKRASGDYSGVTVSTLESSSRRVMPSLR
jgi:hypothetical protein